MCPDLRLCWYENLPFNTNIQAVSLNETHEHRLQFKRAEIKSEPTEKCSADPTFGTSGLFYAKNVMQRKRYDSLQERETPQKAPL